MGIMDNLLNVMKLGDNSDEYDDEDDYEYEEEEVVEKPKKALPKIEENIDYDEELPKKKLGSSSKVTPIRQVKKSSGNGMEVCVIKPTTVEESREITETLLDNRTVILNLEGLDVDIAQRIIDFASGSTYAISGNLQKISNFIFIITPACVDIAGDFQEYMPGAFDVPPISHN